MKSSYPISTGWAQSNDGSIFSWGFGSDGQLGLGERKLTSCVPKRIRHESLRQNVSFIGCGEMYSAAVTGDGRLYMWGKNSHVISVNDAPSKPFFYPVPVDQDERLGTVHSIHCGSWHALVMTGQPDRQPTKSDNLSDSDSESDRELTSGSSLPMSTPRNEDAFKEDENTDQGPFTEDHNAIEKSIPPVGHQNPYSPSPTRSTSGNHGHADANAKQCPPGMTGRGQTRLTIGEFYAMTDSSPSQNGSRSSVSQEDDKDRKVDEEVEDAGGEASVAVAEGETSTEKTPGNQEVAIKISAIDQESNGSSPGLKSPKHRSAPASAKSSSSSSVVSESSLKKRMAENLSANTAFRSREWGPNHQPRQRPLLNKTPARSPNRSAAQASPSPLGLSPRSPHLVPRARSTEQPSTLDRSHTMFISRTPAEQFLLPRREPTFMACQSLALVDLNDLRAGSVFENEDNSLGGGHGQGHAHNPGQVQGQGSRSGSSVASRLDMAPSPTDCDTELSQVFRQRTPLSGSHMATFPQYLSASETPSGMCVTHQRAHDLLGATSILGQNETHPMFTSPSPNLGRQVSNPLLRRSRTMYGQSNIRGTAKYYRKPGLPGAGYKPGTGPGSVRPLLRQTTSLEAISKSHILNSGADRSDLAILTAKQHDTKPLVEPKSGVTGPEDKMSRRPMFSSATSWRTRNHTILGTPKDSTIPSNNKTVHFHLNGVAAKNNDQSDSSKLFSQTSDRGEIRTKTSAVLLGKPGLKNNSIKVASFTDIQRDVIHNKKGQGVEIRAKSVKKYR
ncbi:X-linked retinitis pigmentosa GTPase regulator [Plakobranchus ocellatus]|uniref:X-linked retinitis pigmentosa GTPase regulator n=1 Tax=Plakobranchus ocellatus TaxID=259542 RepID=A0AAV4ABE0_9GAST|nr:X-linked retinitis pigmentosa GTPase regulator [Plakobranchus ocellatus]